MKRMQTKTALLKYCQDVLKKTKTHCDVESDELVILKALIEFHPDYDSWDPAQGDVLRITVARADKNRYATPCFYLHYENGETWIFSFHKCVKRCHKKMLIISLTH